MKQDISWQSILKAIAAAEVRQQYRGYWGAANHWALEKTLNESDAEQIKAYMEANGASTGRFESDLGAAFRAAGKAWKFKRVLLLLILFGAVAGAALLGMLLEVNICLGFLLIWLVIAAGFLKNHRHRRMKKVWKNGGQVKRRMDQLVKLSSANALSAHLVPLVLIVIVAIPLVIGTLDPKLYPYLQCDTLMKEGSYEEAAKAYGALGNYRDSREKASAAWIAEGDEYVACGIETLAIESYEKAGDQERVRSTYYLLAESYLQEENMDRAVQCFLKAGSYKDAQDRAGAIYYEQAEEMLAAGEERKAIELFAEAGEYQDAADRISAIYYENAEDYLAENEPELAAQQFTLAGGYLDAAQRVDALYASLIESAIAAHDYAAAIRLYTTLGDMEMVQNIRYQEAVWHYDSGNYAYAYLRFSEMQDYVPQTGRSVGDYLADEKVIQGAQETMWYTPGSIVVFGAFEQDGHTFNGNEPLEWRVLDSDGSKTLLITRYVVDTCHDDFSTLEWAQSGSRQWLNEVFFQKAFSEKEQSAVLPTLVRNGADTSHPRFGKDAGPTVEDRVFLLSYQEAVQYLGDPPENPPTLTEYAKMQGVSYSILDGLAYSRLRSIDNNGSEGIYVIDTFERYNDITIDNAAHKADDMGVQPVIWVDLSMIAALNAAE